MVKRKDTFAVSYPGVSILEGGAGIFQTSTQTYLSTPAGSISLCALGGGTIGVRQIIIVKSIVMPMGEENPATSECCGVFSFYASFSNGATVGPVHHSTKDREDFRIQSTSRESYYTAKPTLY